jgi:kynureninase
MGPDFVPTPGASGWQLSNPPVLPMAALRASLELFDEATMARLRAKSLALTRYLESLLARLLKEEVRIITPTDPEARGAQLSLFFQVPVRNVYKRLGEEGVIVDIREVSGVRCEVVPRRGCCCACLRLSHSSFAPSLHLAPFPLPFPLPAFRSRT